MTRKSDNQSNRSPELAEFHGQSRRNAFLVDDGCSAWLYLHEAAPNERVCPPVAAVAFVFNHGPPIDHSELESYRGLPPPISADYASDQAVCSNPDAFAWSFLWSADGESIAVLRDDVPVAVIRASEKRGYSKGVSKVGPWGHPWSEVVFDSIF
jgi:hypothetical protein